MFPRLSAFYYQSNNSFFLQSAEIFNVFRIEIADV